MKRALWIVLAVVPLFACKPPARVSPEEAAQAVYGVSSLTRDALLLLSLQDGPAELAPGAESNPDGTQSVAAAILGEARSVADVWMFGIEMLPAVGTSWYDSAGTLYVVRDVSYDPGTGIARITLDVFYPATDERSQALALIDVHTNFTPTDDSDDRLLYVDIDVGYRDGSDETIEFIDLDNCNVQVDCNLDVGREQVRGEHTFTTDPHLSRWYFEVDVDLQTPGDDSDDLFERQAFEAERNDGLVFDRVYVPGVPVAEGQRPATGAITDTVTWPSDFDPREVVHDVDWTSQNEGTVLTRVTYADSSIDSYLTTFTADGMAEIVGTRRDGASVTGTINRNVPHHELHVLAPDGAQVDTELTFLTMSVEAQRTVVSSKGTFTATANIGAGSTGISLHYVDSAGFIGEANIVAHAEGILLRQGEVATPDDVNIGFDLTATPTGEGRVTFDGQGASGYLSMIPVGGARGVVQGRTIDIDAVGRLR